MRSTRGTRVPISAKRLGSLSVTCAGTGWRAARSASAPKRAWRFERACATTPRATVISAAGTLQASAAEATSIARAAAPARRSCS
jgi:hypothetical protein